MKTIIVLCFIVSINYINLLSQYSCYIDYKRTKQIYFDNFKNEGGKNKIEAGNNEPIRYIESFIFPENENFEIKGELENINAATNKPGVTGIYFGYYAFCINSNREFSIMIDGDGIYCIDKFTKSDKIKKGKNKLTIKKIGQIYYLFINEFFVYQTKYLDELNCNEGEGLLGFLAMYETSLHAYRLEVNMIERIPSNTR